MGLQRRLAAATAAAAFQNTAAEAPADSTTESLLQGFLQSKLYDPAAATWGTAEASLPAEHSAPGQSTGAGISSQLGFTPLHISDADQV